ncbi:TPA: hypothetical protein HA241_06935 [Candidatus Woesearchaeota archaeon]|nr:hypothetical protein [Candidatus Woesearchaeota archaeon]
MRMHFFVYVFVVFSFLTILVSADNPPSLVGFQQVYGLVHNVTVSGYQLNITTPSFATLVLLDAEDRFGYDRALKVYGRAGEQISFILVPPTGNKTILGLVPYAVSSLTYLEFDFRQPGNFTVNETTTPPPSADNDDDDRRPSRNRNNTNTSVNATGICRYNWECSLWSDCTVGQQSRDCYHADRCDDLLAQRLIGSIDRVESPAESRACTATESEAPAVVCAAGQKRCQGTVLQECSSVGTEWRFVQSCTQGCDTVAGRCVAAPVEQQPAPVVQESSFSLWYYVGGGVVLIALVGGVILLWYWHKYKPVKEYIKNTRLEGYADEKIQMKLIGEGWDPKRVEKLMK